jgi:hypothetical protein
VATVRADLQAFESGESYFRVDVPKGMTPQQFEGDVEAAATRYVAEKYDAVMGPNSNSAVGYAILQAGGTLPVVTGWFFGARKLEYYQRQNHPTSNHPGGIP